MSESKGFVKFRELSPVDSGTIYTDIPGSKTLEAELRAKEARLREMLEGKP